MMRAFRKYHRMLALIVILPLVLTVITGMIYPIVADWFHADELGELLLKVHTMEIIGLEDYYPILNGLGLIAMIVTGITMTSLFRRRPASASSSGES
jgi:hypothetical protein